MNILVVGDSINIAEVRRKFANHQLAFAGSRNEIESLVAGKDVIFDFLTSGELLNAGVYDRINCAVFLNASAYSLHHLLRSNSPGLASFFGFNGWPTFFSAEIFEVSAYRKGDEQRLAELCTALGTEFQIVNDQPGMVTPRVLSMIINEAYHAVGDGIATREDVDLAMRLGTNYPYGPFEWSQRIGLNNVYQTLKALKEETRDARYFIAPLLEKECAAISQ